MHAVFPALKNVLPPCLVWVGWCMYGQATLFITQSPHYNGWLVALTILLNILFFYTNTKVVWPRLYARHQHWRWSYLAGLLGLGVLLTVFQSKLRTRFAGARPGVHCVHQVQEQFQTDAGGRVGARCGAGGVGRRCLRAVAAFLWKQQHGLKRQRPKRAFSTTPTR